MAVAAARGDSVDVDDSSVEPLFVRDFLGEWHTQRHARHQPADCHSQQRCGCCVTRGRDGTAGLMYGMHAWVCMAALGLHGGVGFHCEGFSDGDVSFMAQMAISYGLSRDTGTCLNIPGVR